ncbi:MAG: hypothetical protein P9F19_18095 [Candidatus Contendobacter sp.]|nr:hypothetical protein [Candidatus Contendobacter sp.]MDG4559278.1 hypothetical protein [Candidatus Contendobacter sp.]
MHPKIALLLPGFAVGLLLVVGYVLYLPGQGGMFNFDDSVNLKGLANVRDGWSALVFLVTGEAGALSRPVALASFLLNWGDWPSTPQGFLYINILIHLLNGALLTWLALRLVYLTISVHPQPPTPFHIGEGEQRKPLFRKVPSPLLGESQGGECERLPLTQPQPTQRAEWIAVSTAALWLLSPLLASTSLIIIQRMASLCATFVLAGLLVYLIGLSWEAAGRVKRGRWLQAGGIGLGTLLAVLAKENGILLSLYALILEGTVLAGIKELNAARRWRIRLLAVPPLLLLAYIALRWPAMMTVYAGRDFTLGQRLMTEAVILWDYLRLALLPRPVAFSPFNDDYPVVRSLFEQPWALLALMGWLATAAWAFRQRRRWPLFALAILWYLGGHALESTVLPLELYFEHRNYLPLIGPALALSWWVWTLEPSNMLRRIALTALGGYTLLLAAMLWQLTTLWGQPLIAAELWARRHPTSPRAIHFLATGYLAVGNVNTVRQILERAAYARPAAVGIALVALPFTCKNGDPDATRALYRLAETHAATGEYSGASANSLSRLREMLSRGECPGLDRADLHTLADRLIANPLYAASGRRLGHLHYIQSELYRDERDLEGTLRHLFAAHAADPDIGAIALIVGTLLSAGLRDEARAFLEQAQQHLPLNPVLRIEWRKIIDQLWEVVDGHQAHGTLP